MKHLFAALFLSCLFITQAQAGLQKIPFYGEEFYNAVDGGASGKEITTILNKVLKNSHRSVGYEKSKIFMLAYYYLLQNGQNYLVKEVYCDFEYPSPGPGILPKNEQLNVEHTWPQSKFTSNYQKDIQKADLHHLFPSDSQVNSTRGNHPFGEVVSVKKDLKCPASKFGFTSDHNLVFEPPRSHQGNVARALFYFSVRYEIPISNSEEAFLRKWHQEDPVDDEEMDRNMEIARAQGNRNPFIDYPSLVNKISDF